MGFLKIFGIAVLAVMVVLVLVGGYFGFIPGVSNIFGSNKPRDLGAVYAQSDYQSARNKMGTNITELPPEAPPEQSIRITNINNVNINLTQNEVNAIVNINEWKYYPVTNCQVNIHTDNTVEFSGIILKDRVENCAKALGASDNDIQVLMSYVRYVPTNPIVYFVGTFTIIENKVTILEVNELQIGRLSFLNQFQEKRVQIIQIVESWLAQSANFKIRTCRFVNGQLQYEGSIPDVAISKGR